MNADETVGSVQLYSSTLVYKLSPDKKAGGAARLPKCHATHRGCFASATFVPIFILKKKDFLL